MTDEIIPLDRAAFVLAIAARFRAVDPALGEELPVELAEATLEAYLDAEQIAFGDDEHCWDTQAAIDAADIEIAEWESAS